MKTISINHNEVEGERVHLHLEHNKSGYTWHTDDGEDVGQPASKTIQEAYDLASHVWGAAVWGLQFHRS